jgi:hypothetical protein
MQQSSDVAETITHANGDAEDPRPAHSLRRHLDHVRVSSGRFAPEAAGRERPLERARGASRYKVTRSQ